MAIQRWDGKQVKGAEQQIQRKHHAQQGGQKLEHAGLDGFGDLRETHRFGRAQCAGGHSGADARSGQQHQCEIGQRPRQSHQRGAARVALLPQWVVRRAGPADHPATPQKRNHGCSDHADGLPADVRDRIQRDLPGQCCGGVAAELRGQRMCAFVAGGGEKKGDVPDHAQCEHLGRQIHTRTD